MADQINTTSSYELTNGSSRGIPDADVLTEKINQIIEQYNALNSQVEELLEVGSEFRQLGRALRSMGTEIDRLS